MTFFHTLILTIVLPTNLGGELRTSIPFPDEFSCGQALPAIVAEVTKSFPGSFGVCRPTTLMSSSPRPQARPN
jgi:hypothetical protein